MTYDLLTRFLEGLEEHDLSLTAGLRELVRRSDSGGRIERSDWTASVRAVLEGLAGELGSHGVDMMSDEGEAFAHFLEDHVVSRLERELLVTSQGDAREGGTLVFNAELWAEIEPRREELLDRLDELVKELEARRAEAFRVEDTAAPLVDGSRLSGVGLTKIYKRRKVVNEVDIAVRQGEIVGLLGPNGAGKTTTFYMLVGLIPPNGGTVHLDDEDLTGTPMYRRARKGIGYLAQEPSVFRRLTVEGNVLAILETLKLPKGEERARLEELLGELGLEHLRKSKAFSLSGGERRRLEITRALVQGPKFMLLDEPFAGIDPIAVNDIQQIVRGLRSRSIGVIITDHNVEQTLEIVDRAYIMYEGRIHVGGTVSELVWNDEVAEIYLGPTLTTRMRGRFPEPAGAGAGGTALGGVRHR